MSKKTYIKGKDSDLEGSIKSMQSKLHTLGFQVKEGTWLNPVAYVYSVLIEHTSCPCIFTNGKGSCEKSCRASALGEFFERMSSNYFFADYYLGKEVTDSSFVHYPSERWFDGGESTLPEGLLNEKLWQYYNPEDELHADQLFDLNSGAGEKGICALPFERISDGEILYFPVNILGNLYVSNGMAAGNTKAEARVQALSEIFERYVKNRIIAEGISLPDIPKDVIARYEHIKVSIDALESHGYYLKVSDASLGGVYPVICVTLINPKDGSVFASFGSHPCFEVALERTVTELLQGRGVDALNDFSEPSFNLDEVASEENLETHFVNATGLISYDFFKDHNDYEFVDWNYDYTTQSEFEYLCELIYEMDCDVYIADYEHLHVYTCRIIVPGISEIYPVEDLVWSNNNEGALFRESLLTLNDLHVNEWEMILENLEASEVPDVTKVAEFIGIIPDVNTVWERLQVGELKAMLSLAVANYETALEWVSWSAYTAQLDEQGVKHYRCLRALLEIAIDDEKKLSEYEDALTLMYGCECVTICTELINGTQNFYGLHTPGLSLEGFSTHKKLLEVYATLHQAKQV